jgi:hypothetical protein
MSQHFFQTKHNDKDVVVQLGHDRSIGHLFMIVQVTGSQEDPIYSNLCQADPFGLTVTDYRRALQELGITVPAEMFVAVEVDRLLDAPDRVVWYEADGTFEVQ